MAEADLGGSFASDELGERFPASAFADVVELVPEDFDEQVGLEARADDCSVPKQKAIIRREGVDARRDQGLDRLRQHLGVPRAARRLDELADEERVPTRALANGSEGLGRECELTGGLERKGVRHARPRAGRARGERDRERRLRASLPPDGA